MFKSIEICVETIIAELSLSRTRDIKIIMIVKTETEERGLKGAGGSSSSLKYRWSKVNAVV